MDLCTRLLKNGNLLVGGCRATQSHSERCRNEGPAERPYQAFDAFLLRYSEWRRVSEDIAIHIISFLRYILNIRRRRLLVCSQYYLSA